MDSQPESNTPLRQAQQYLDQAYLYYDETEEIDKALEACEAALELDPVLTDAYNLRGILLEELGRKFEALKAYQKAIRLDPGFTEAKNNLAALTSELASGEQLITIATFSYPTEAYIPKTKLETEGIPSFLANEYTVNMYWLYSNAVGGVKLQVKAGDVERALAILTPAPLASEEIEEDQEDSAEDDSQCPNCHSVDITYEKYRMGWVFASWLLSGFSLGFFFGIMGGFPLPFLKRKWHCRDCRYEWL
jgi:tetratricopeptide (TPR) repeat protein